ncbi:adaptor complexes medium subunit family protein [Thecamonas trahens ATCC 50062]|uniref:Adaptor complexes medium subunit family protein n=1 Tax=Thecamonas trahens ATCC 50062 TaxID=461836 RepID=A0A0L0DR67_THETB|nr:adaptor complexes medium subunit family protein [Thecamonas trahens ATCC 50062]KNC54770.1 adaptor complexes medium subunit family protein [Thecamonas trahens ATCC 50062]|eukprot:XP_013761670.1 adaptor complexes medium subunit family protein [Thecamonas trahens ATCC 50062]
MAAFSQFFVLSGRGDTIVSKDYRGDVVKGTPDIFWRKVQASRASRGGGAGPSSGVGLAALPPAFHINGLNFIHVARKGLYLVFTTKFNVSPVFAVELLDRFAAVFKDYTGELSEDKLRKNFVLVYEILDEILDYGWVQSTSSDHLRAHIVNVPEAAFGAGEGSSGGTSASTSGKGKGGIKAALAKFRDRAAAAAIKHGVAEPTSTAGVARTASSAAAQKPITLEHRRTGGDEVFVDLLERLIVVFGKDGSIVRSQIDGSIQVKAFVNGNPHLVLALNEDLSVGGAGDGYGIVVDDISFHEGVNLDDFDARRLVAFPLESGESTLMSYRLKSEFRTPFRVFVFLEEVSASAFDVVLRIRADFPNTTFGKGVRVSLPLPGSTYNATLDLPAGVGGQSYAYAKESKTMTWLIENFRGGAEHHARVRVHLDGPEEYAVWSQSVGPASLAFEIPMHSLSGLAIRSLRIIDANPNYKPARWVRYISHSNSYVCRV